MVDLASGSPGIMTGVNSMLQVSGLLSSLISRRCSLRWLLVVNALGAAYGFAWYGDQLAGVPLWLWPLTADSPMSLLFSSLALASWLRGRRWPVMEGLAYLGLLKYGFWTMLVVGRHWSRGGFAWDIDLFLFASHAFMAVQAVLLGLTRGPGASAVAVALLWYLANDYADYLHPEGLTLLPVAELSLVRAISLASTPIFAILLLWVGGPRNRAGSSAPSRAGPAG
jgi:uncharacterized membrane protein YpjA